MSSLRRCPHFRGVRTVSSDTVNSGGPLYAEVSSIQGVHCMQKCPQFRGSTVYRSVFNSGGPLYAEVSLIQGVHCIQKCPQFRGSTAYRSVLISGVRISCNVSLCHVFRLLKRSLFEDELEPNWPSPEKVQFTLVTMTTPSPYHTP